MASKKESTIVILICLVVFSLFFFVPPPEYEQKPIRIIAGTSIEAWGYYDDYCDKMKHYTGEYCII